MKNIKFKSRNLVCKCLFNIFFEESIILAFYSSYVIISGKVQKNHKCTNGQKLNERPMEILRVYFMIFGNGNHHRKKIRRQLKKG